EVLYPLQIAVTLYGLIPIDTEWFIRTGVVRVGVETLASKQPESPITPQIRDRHSVSLRPSIVNDMFDPSGVSIGFNLSLVPENAVVMPHAGDQVGHAVAVDVLHVNEPNNTQIEFGVEYPLAIPRVRGSLEPSFRGDDVGPCILTHLRAH